MQWFLFVLILIGQCSFFTCHLYEYHFIQERKSWDDAQSYCREKYTDLATVSDMGDLERLTNPPQTDAWIGLRSINEADIKEWHWSLPGEKYNPREGEPEWGPNEPNNGGNHPENCVKITLSQKWYNVRCYHKLHFICYNDKVILIKEKKTWDKALDYCRANHSDLVSITDQQRWVQDRAKMADAEFVWLGMRYTCTLDLWFWVSDRLVCYHHWAQQERTEGCDRATATETDGEWYKKADNEK
ncbi:hypothetical protein JOQ06_012039 [Pogonophryne albipinna]|uniref:C-type lectin domain-containing protein n=1 Tax=Pogonophryne albipinna TaxID=1090488 RepID=A0AAD6FNR2_9TELE|nr:hypothetical protein JOQ06_012039 [Pogonophryne albipinna]